MRHDDNNTIKTVSASDQTRIDHATVQSGKRIAIAIALGISSIIAGILWKKSQSKIMFGTATIVTGLASINSAAQAYRECEVANAIEDQSKRGAVKRSNDAQGWAKRLELSADHDLNNKRAI